MFLIGLKIWDTYVEIEDDKYKYILHWIEDNLCYSVIDNFSLFNSILVENESRSCSVFNTNLSLII